MIVDQRTLADMFGVSSRTIRTWQAEGMPAGGSRRQRKYETEDCIAWAAANKLQSGKAPRGEASEETPPAEDVSDRRWKQARAALKQLELEEEKGRLIPLRVHVDRIREVAESIRDRLMNLPGRYARELAAVDEPREVTRLLERAVREALEELQRLEADEQGEDKDGTVDVA